MKKNLKKIAIAVGTACLCAGFAFSAPVSVLRAEAAVNAPVILKQRLISYQYRVHGHMFMKRLYNYSTGEALGDWEFVRWLTDEEVEQFSKIYG